VVNVKLNYNPKKIVFFTTKITEFYKLKNKINPYYKINNQYLILKFVIKLLLYSHTIIH